MTENRKVNLEILNEKLLLVLQEIGNVKTSIDDLNDKYEGQKILVDKIAKDNTRLKESFKFIYNSFGEKKVIVDKLSKENEELKKSMEFLSAQYDDFKAKFDNVLEENNKTKNELKKDNDLLRSECKELKSSLMGVRKSTVGLCSAAFNESLQISPVAFKEGESVVEIVKKIILNLKEGPGEKDIESVYRRKHTKKGEPGAIVIRCNSSVSRDKFLSAIKKSVLSQKDLGFEGDTRKIFAREELHPLSRDLFFKALEFKRNEGYKFLWIKNGKIFLRKLETEKCFLITDLMDLERLKINA